MPISIPSTPDEFERVVKELIRPRPYVPDIIYEREREWCEHTVINARRSSDLPAIEIRLRLPLYLSYSEIDETVAIHVEIDDIELISVQDYITGQVLVSHVDNAVAELFDEADRWFWRRWMRNSMRFPLTEQEAAAEMIRIARTHRALPEPRFQPFDARLIDDHARRLTNIHRAMEDTVFQSAGISGLAEHFPATQTAPPEATQSQQSWAESRGLPASKKKKPEEPEPVIEEKDDRPDAEVRFSLLELDESKEVAPVLPHDSEERFKILELD